MSTFKEYEKQIKYEIDVENAIQNKITKLPVETVLKMFHEEPDHPFVEKYRRLYNRIIIPPDLLNDIYFSDNLNIEKVFNFMSFPKNFDNVKSFKDLSTKQKKSFVKFMFILSVNKKYIPEIAEIVKKCGIDYLEIKSFI